MLKIMSENELTLAIIQTLKEGKRQAYKVFRVGNELHIIFLKLIQ